MGFDLRFQTDVDTYLTEVDIRFNLDSLFSLMDVSIKCLRDRDKRDSILLQSLRAVLEIWWPYGTGVINGNAHFWSLCMVPDGT